MAYPYYPQSYGMNYGYNMPQQPSQQTIIRVQSEAQARAWTVSPGCSVMFIDDVLPYCYTKSMGSSPFEAPVFKRFRLTEEDLSQNAQPNVQAVADEQVIEATNYLTKDEFEPFKAIIDDIQEKFKEMSKNESDAQPYKHNCKPNNSKST